MNIDDFQAVMGKLDNQIAHLEGRIVSTEVVMQLRYKVFKATDIIVKKVEKIERREEKKMEQTPAPLSELEQTLYERFKAEKSIEIDNLDQREKGALGKLAARKLVEKNQDVPEVGQKKKKAVWKVKEGD